MEDYSPIFDPAVLEFVLEQAAQDREVLLRAFAHLAAEPVAPTDIVESDHLGKMIHTRGFRPFAVSFWLDSPLKEVRILEIQRILP